MNERINIIRCNDSPPNKKTVILVIAIALLTITMCAVFFSLILMLEPESEPEPDDSFIFPDHSLSVLTCDSGHIFVFDNKTVVQAAGTKKILQKNLYNTCAIYLDEENSLYFVDKNGYIKIGDNVMTATLSDTGNYVVYISSSASLFNILYRYDIGKNISSVVDRSTGLSANTNLLFSPNGKTFIYSKHFVKDDFYVSNNGEKGTLLEDIANVDTISNGGKYLLWHTDDNEFFYRFEGVDYPINTDIPESIFTNRNCNEFIYSTKNNGSYVITEKSDIRKISDNSLVYLYFPSYSLRGKNRTLAINHFNRKVFLSQSLTSLSYDMTYIDSRYNDVTFAGINIPMDSYQSYNLSTFYFVKYGSLIKFNRNNSEKVEVISRGVLSDSLIVSRNGKYLYYIDLKKNLYCIYHGEVYLVSENVEKAVLNVNDKLYFMTDDKIMVLKNKTGYSEVYFEETVYGGILYEQDGHAFYQNENNIYLLDGNKGMLIFSDSSQE
ncbi:MAG: hypothetical protein IKT70_02875 [Clostridia bacterium]|nr:hypothetical protein [Clostridia bacterium]